MAAVRINDAFPHAYLELANLYEGDNAMFNTYLDKAIGEMTASDFQPSELLGLEYYFREVIYLTQVSTYQLQYFESRRK